MLYIPCFYVIMLSIPCVYVIMLSIPCVYVIMLSILFKDVRFVSCYIWLICVE